MITALPRIPLTCQNGHTFTTGAHGGQSMKCPRCRTSVWIPAHRPRTAHEAVLWSRARASEPPTGRNTASPWDSLTSPETGRQRGAQESCQECGEPAWLTFGGTQHTCPAGHIGIAQKVRDKVPPPVPVKSHEEVRQDKRRAAERSVEKDLARAREYDTVKSEVATMIAHLHDIGTGGAMRCTEELTRRFTAWDVRFRASPKEELLVAREKLHEYLTYCGTIQRPAGEPQSLPMQALPDDREAPKPAERYRVTAGQFARTFHLADPEIIDAEILDDDEDDELTEDDVYTSALPSKDQIAALGVRIGALARDWRDTRMFARRQERTHV